MESQNNDQTLEGLFATFLVIMFVGVFGWVVNFFTPDLVVTKVEIPDGPNSSVLLDQSLCGVSLFGVHLHPEPDSSKVRVLGYSILGDFMKDNDGKVFGVSHEWVQSPNLPGLESSIWCKFDESGALLILTHQDGEIFSDEKLREKRIIKGYTKTFEPQ